MQAETVRVPMRAGQPDGAKPTLKGVPKASRLFRPESAKTLSQNLTERLPSMIGSAPLLGPSVSARLEDAYGKLPLRFEPNEGQTDHRVQFLSRGQGYTLFLTSEGAVLALQEPGRLDSTVPKNGPHEANFSAAAPIARIEIPLARGLEPAAQDVVRMELDGADHQAQVNGLDELSGRTNYLIGNDPEKWRTNVPSYAKVRYQDVYPGIDLVYYSGKQQQLEYDFVVQPGADPNSIRLAVKGGESNVSAGNSRLENGTPKLEILANGDLAIHVEGGELRLQKPVAYQPKSTRNGADGTGPGSLGSGPLDARYVLMAGNRVGFKVCAYDHTRPLVIDPTLVYSTYFPSGAAGIAADSSGAVYIVGSTTSATFPVTNPLPAPNNGLQGTQDAFVAKLNAAGTAFVYATYLGGTNVDQGSGIAVDSSGNAYVTGTTKSTDFPVVNAYQSSLKGTSNAFLAKLNASGNALLYSTYLGGTGTDTGAAIALDSTGRAYLAGATQSKDFPTTSGVYQAFLAGSQNAYIAQFDATKLGPSSLLVSGYLGGSSYDSASGVGVDSSGNILIAGTTASMNFPVLSAYQSSIGQAQESGFVAKFNSTLSALAYSTYLGGNYFNGPPLQNSYNIIRGLAVDSAGNAYVAGETDAYDFPLNQAYQSTCQSLCTWDGFIAKFSPTGTNIYSTDFGGGTFLSGPNTGSGFYGTSIYGIATDASGDAYVTGSVEAGSFPLMSPLQSIFGGGLTALYVGNSFVSELNATGGLAFSTLLGGSGYQDIGMGIAVDGSNNIYVTGNTYSQDFPIIAGGLQTQLVQGQTNTFVSKISPLNTPAMSVTPGNLSFASQADGTTSAARTVLVHDLSSSTLTVSNIAISGAFPSDFQFINNCSAPIAGAGACGIPVTFTPSIIGPETALLTVTASGAAGSPATITLSGVGASNGIPAITPSTSVNFGNVTVGSPSAPQTFTLTNNGTGQLGAITFAFGSGILVSNNTCTSTLAAGAKCTFTVSVTPSTVGYFFAQITIANDSALGTQYINMTANGVSVPLPLQTNGDVLAWGYYAFVPGWYSTAPSVVGTLSGMTAIAGGWNSSLALDANGNVWAWGSNYSGELGNGSACCAPPAAGPFGGNSGYVAGTFVPAQVSGISSVTAIAVGQHESLTLKTDGTVWDWGSNLHGGLGNGNNTDSPTPVQVTGFSGVTAISGGGGFNMALKNDESVWTWGYNGDGELGNGSTTDSNTPIQVTGVTHVYAISGGANHALALKTDGTIYAWGDNTNGELGNGTTTGSNVPALASITTVGAVAAGNGFSLALKNDGTVWAWGNNSTGQLGNGTNTNSSTPVQVSGLTNVKAITAGFGHALALKTDGTVWAWGDNIEGELGSGSTISTNTPVQVAVPCGVIVTAIAAGQEYSLALTQLTTNPAPCITSPNSAAFYEGIAGTFTLSATGAPTPSLSIGSLPTGLTFVDNGNGTATLSGTPTSGTAGTYPLTVTAQNGVSPNANQPFMLIIGLISASGNGGLASSGSSGNGGNGTSSSGPCACYFDGPYVNPAAPTQLGKVVAKITNISQVTSNTSPTLVTVVTASNNGITQVTPPTGGIAQGPNVTIKGVKPPTGLQKSPYDGSYNAYSVTDLTHYQYQQPALNAIGASPSSGGTSTALANPLQSLNSKYKVTATIVGDPSTTGQSYSDIKITDANNHVWDFGGHHITTHWDFSPDEDRFYMDTTDPSSASPCTEEVDVYDLTVTPARLLVHIAQTVEASQAQFSPSGEYFVYRSKMYSGGCYSTIANPQVDLEIYKVQKVTSPDKVYSTLYNYLPGGSTNEDQIFGNVGNWGFSPDKPETSFMYAYYPSAGSPQNDVYWTLVNLTTGLPVASDNSVPATGSFWQFNPCGSIAALVQSGQVAFYSTTNGNILGQLAFGTSVALSSVSLQSTIDGEQLTYGSTKQIVTRPNCGPPNTMSGKNVKVQPVDSGSTTAPVSITFSNVSQPGESTVTSTNTAPNSPGPANFKLGTPPTYYDIATSALYTPPSPPTITVCVNYKGFKYTTADLSKLALWHYDTSVTPAAWTNITISGPPTDMANKIICGTTTSLSPFAVFEPVAPLPAAIAATAGASQSTPVYTAMPTPLQATVTDSSGNPVSGVEVIFTAPAVEPTSSFAGSSLAYAITNASGVAVAPALTADGVAGSYTVTASVDGMTSLANFALINSQVGTSVQLSTSPVSPIPDGTPVVLTANVNSATVGIPTGTVNFLFGTKSLGTARLVQGVATLTATTLPSGNDNIQAGYSGDTNFTASTSPVETVSINAPDYSFSASPTTASLAAGQSTNPPITLTVSPAGYSGTVTLACGTLPAYLTCTFSPSSGTLTFASSATAAQTAQLTIAVASQVSTLQHNAPTFWAMIVPLGLFACLPLIGEDCKRTRRYLGMMALAILIVGIVSSCNSGSNKKLPPAGTQTVTVTAAGSSPSGTISHQLQVTVTITN